MISSSSKTVRIYWTNHGYYANETFATVADAVAHAKKVFFEATILDGENIVGSWTVFGGFRDWR